MSFHPSTASDHGEEFMKQEDSGDIENNTHLLRVLIRQQEEMLRLQKEEMRIVGENKGAKNYPNTNNEYAPPPPRRASQPSNFGHSANTTSSHDHNAIGSEAFEDDGELSYSTNAIEPSNNVISVEGGEASSTWRYDLGGNRIENKSSTPDSIDEEVHLLKNKMEALEATIADLKKSGKKNHHSLNARKSMFSTIQAIGEHHDEDSNKKCLTGDTFTLMMISRVRSPAWALGAFTFMLEMTLGAMIAYDQISANSESFFEIPFAVKPEVYVVQFLTIGISLAMQGDILTSVRSFLIMGGDSNWDYVIGEDGNRSCCLWFARVAIPNILKLVQGLTVTFVSFIIIAQGTNIIDLLKDFTALMFISEMDNINFQLAAFGYLGKELRMDTLKIEEMDAPETLPGRKKTWKRGVIVVRVAFIALLVAYLGGWGAIVHQQKAGEFFKQMYPKCDIKNYDLAFKHFGDGVCFGGPLNTIECKFEDGDCHYFNMAYPNCRGGDLEKLENVENEVGNRNCNAAFNITECGYDGGDCLL